MNKLRFTRNAVRVTTVIIMVSIVGIATADGFAQSYSGLYEWALLHKLSGWKAETFPLLVDLFILVGELGLFLLAIDGYKVRASFLSWTDIVFPAAVATAGWGVSLWFNVNHIPNATTEDKVTAGVPPVAAMVGLFILLRTVHRYMAQLDEMESAPEEAPEITPKYVTEIGTLSGIPSLDDQREIASHTPVIEVPAELAAAHEDATAGEVPEVKPANLNGHKPYGKGPDHPKWDEGVKIYRESVKSPGKALSQRELAEALSMRNRSLAAHIIQHVKKEINDGNDNGVPEATETAASKEG